MHLLISFSTASHDFEGAQKLPLWGHFVAAPERSLKVKFISCQAPFDALLTQKQCPLAKCREDLGMTGCQFPH